MLQGNCNQIIIHPTAAQNRLYHRDIRGASGTELPRTKDLLRIAVVEVVKENSTQPTGLAAVLDDKVFIAPLLEFGVVLGVMLVTGRLHKSQFHQDNTWLAAGFRRGNGSLALPDNKPVC